MAFWNSLATSRLAFQGVSLSGSATFSTPGGFNGTDMRSSIHILATSVVFLASSFLPSFVHAQAANGDRAGERRPADASGDAKRILEEMTEEERESFRAAVNQVWHSDEVEKHRQAMQEANLAYRRALHEEIRKLNASDKVRSVLLRLLKLRFKQEGISPDGAGAPNTARQPGMGPRFSEEEQSIVNAARQKAEKTPMVLAAKLNVDRAVTTRDRMVASAQYRRAMRKAMEAADPRVARIFARRDRLRPRPPERSGIREPKTERKEAAEGQ